MAQPSDTVSLRITLRYKDLDEFVNRYAENISSAGLFLRTKSPKTAGTKIRFELLLADGGRALRGEGVVVTVREDEKPGMALRFNMLDAESQAVIDRIVANHGQGSLAPTPLSTSFGRPSYGGAAARPASTPSWRGGGTGWVAITPGPGAAGRRNNPTTGGGVLPRRPSRVFDTPSKPKPREPSGPSAVPRKPLPRQQSSMSRPWARNEQHRETTDRIRVRDTATKTKREDSSSTRKPTLPPIGQPAFEETDRTLRMDMATLRTPSTRGDTQIDPATNVGEARIATHEFEADLPSNLGTTSPVPTVPAEGMDDEPTIGMDPRAFFDEAASEALERGHDDASDAHAEFKDGDETALESDDDAEAQHADTATERSSDDDVESDGRAADDFSSDSETNTDDDAGGLLAAGDDDGHIAARADDGDERFADEGREQRGTDADDGDERRASDADHGDEHRAGDANDRSELRVNDEQRASDGDERRVDDELRASDAYDEQRASDAHDERRASDADDERRASDADDERHASDAYDEQRASDAYDEQRASDAHDEQRASDADEEQRASDAHDEQRAADAGDERHASDADDERRATGTDYEQSATSDDDEQRADDDRHATDDDDQRATSADHERHATDGDEPRANSTDDERRESDDDERRASDAHDGDERRAIDGDDRWVASDAERLDESEGQRLPLSETHHADADHLGEPEAARLADTAKFDERSHEAEAAVYDSGDIAAATANAIEARSIDTGADAEPNESSDDDDDRGLAASDPWADALGIPPTQIPAPAEDIDDEAPKTELTVVPASLSGEFGALDDADDWDDVNRALDDDDAIAARDGGQTREDDADHDVDDHDAVAARDSEPTSEDDVDDHNAVAARDSEHTSEDDVDDHDAVAARDGGQTPEHDAEPTDEDDEFAAAGVATDHDREDDVDGWFQNDDASSDESESDAPGAVVSAEIDDTEEGATLAAAPLDAMDDEATRLIGDDAPISTNDIATRDVSTVPPDSGVEAVIVPQADDQTRDVSGSTDYPARALADSTAEEDSEDDEDIVEPKASQEPMDDEPTVHASGVSPSDQFEPEEETRADAPRAFEDGGETVTSVRVSAVSEDDAVVRPVDRRSEVFDEAAAHLEAEAAKVKAYEEAPTLANVSLDAQTEIVQAYDATAPSSTGSTPMYSTEVQVTGLDAEGTPTPRDRKASGQARTPNYGRVIERDAAPPRDPADMLKKARAADFSEEATEVPPERIETPAPTPQVSSQKREPTQRIQRPNARPRVRANRVVGIDFGGDWVRIGILENNELELISAGSTPYIPALVASRANGALVTGAKARSIFADDPTRGVSPRAVLHAMHGNKIDANKAQRLNVIGTDAGHIQLKLGDRVFDFDDVLATFLRFLREAIVTALGSEAFSIALSVPDDFDPSARRILQTGCKAAKLEIARLVTESEAMIQAYNLDERPVDAVLMIDVGMTHIGVSVAKRGDSGLAVVKSSWSDALSAKSLDERVVALTLDELRDQAGEDHHADHSARVRLAEAVEHARLDIHRAPAIELKVTLPAPGGASGVVVERSIRLPRSRIYQVTEDVVRDICLLVQETLREADVDPRSIGATVLAGSGGTFPPFVQAIASLTQNEPLQAIPTAHVFAHGLARSGIAIERAASASRPDTLNASIGIGLPGGRFRPLLQAGSKLPATLTKSYPTTKDGQSEIELKFYQGDAEFIRTCTYLGELTLHGLPRGLRGETIIDLQISVAPDGVVNVVLSEKTSGARQQLTAATAQTPQERRRQIASTRTRLSQETDQKTGGFFSRLFGRK